MAVIDWILTKRCNLNCYYCLQGSDTRKVPCNPVNIEFFRFVKSNNNLFHLTGGEPFLVPNFIDICQSVVVSKNLLGINTNLTISPKAFIASISCEDVTYINASVHYPYRRKSMKTYISHFRELRDSGYFVVGSCVMVPEMFEDIVSFIDDVRIEHGIGLFPKLMRGISHGISYPKGYNVFQINEINRLTNLASEEAFNLNAAKYELFCKLSPSIDAWRYEDGLPVESPLCFDGRHRIHLEENGNLIVCGDKRIGNIYTDGLVESPINLTCPYIQIKGDKQYCKLKK